MLQCRSGKRTGTAALRIALDLEAEGLINKVSSRSVQSYILTYTLTCACASAAGERNGCVCAEHDSQSDRELASIR